MQGDVRGTLRCPDGQEVKDEKPEEGVGRSEAPLASRGTNGWRMPLIRKIRQGAAGWPSERQSQRVCDNRLCGAGGTEAEPVGWRGSSS